MTRPFLTDYIFQHLWVALPEVGVSQDDIYCDPRTFGPNDSGIQIDYKGCLTGVHFMGGDCEVYCHDGQAEFHVMRPISIADPAFDPEEVIWLVVDYCAGL